MLKLWTVLLLILANFIFANDNKTEEVYQPDSAGNYKVKSKIENKPLLNLVSSKTCNDSLYLALKKKNLENMTEREFTYFLHKDKLCCDSLLKDYRTEFIVKEESSKIYKTRSILTITSSFLSLTLSTIMIFTLFQRG